MSALYCRLHSDAAKKEVARLGHDAVRSELETWDGRIITRLDGDGNFTVTVAPKYGGTFDERVVAAGNVDTEEARRAAAIKEGGELMHIKKKAFDKVSAGGAFKSWQCYLHDGTPEDVAAEIVAAEYGGAATRQLIRQLQLRACEFETLSSLLRCALPEQIAAEVWMEEHKRRGGRIS